MRNEIAGLKRFTHPRLTPIVRQNAAEFFEQVKKTGAQPDDTEAARESRLSDSSEEDAADETEGLFGYAGAHTKNSPDSAARLSTSPDGFDQLIEVQMAKAWRREVIDVDYRPAVKVGDIIYRVRAISSASVLKADAPCSPSQEIISQFIPIGLKDLRPTVAIFSSPAHAL